MALGQWEREPSSDSVYTRPFRRLRQSLQQQFATWKQTLSRDPELACQYLFPWQDKILKNITPEGIQITERLGGYPIDPGQLQNLLDGRTSYFRKKVRGATVETRRIDGVEIARLPYLTPQPYELLPKVVGITSWDLLVSDIYDRGSGNNQLFSTCTFRGETFPLRDERGYAYPPNQRFKDPIAQMVPGEDTMTFSSANGKGINMHVTKLPIRAGANMPRYAFITEKERAKKDVWKQTLTEARRRNMAIVFLVKSSQLGIAKAMFWQDLEDTEYPHRVFIRNDRGNHYDFDDTPLKQERFTREPIDGTLDVIIEYLGGGLEDVQREYRNGIATKDPSPRYQGVMAVAIGDIIETGTSLVKYSFGIIDEVFQCPPVAIRFDIT